VAVDLIPETGTMAPVERLSLPEVIDEVLSLKSALLKQYHIAVVKNDGSVPQIPLQRSKTFHIRLTLIHSAADALRAVPIAKHRRCFEIRSDPQFLFLDVCAIGQGIPQPEISRVFQHGFSTKTDGHGFGLHSAATDMAEMGGTIRVESAGPGRVARFSLQFKRD